MAEVHDRSQLLVDAARQLFMDKGFAAVGMRDITARAGLTPTQAYRLGLAKEDLLAEISIALTAEQLRTITPQMAMQPGEPLRVFVERYLQRLYESDIEHIRIRRESAAYGWMWSSKYEQRIVAQVMSLLQPIADAMQTQGLNMLPARGFTIWSLYYVGYRAAVVAGADARQCVAAISDSLALALRP